MEATPREIIFLDAGTVKLWLDILEEDNDTDYQMILARLERVEDGNFGDCGSVGGGVSELRFIGPGPGYRIYFGQHDDFVVLLTAVTKRSQLADIERAKRLWAEYKQNG